MTNTTGDNSYHPGQRPQSPYQPFNATGQDPTYPSPEAPAPEDSDGKRGRGIGGVIALIAILSLLVGGVAGGVAGYAVSSTGDEPAPSTGPDNALTAPPADAPDTPAGSVEEVADAVLPTVVSIQVVTPMAAGEGSGSIFTSDGYVLTNHHVVAGAEDGAMQVTLNDGTDMTADFVASDAATDIAVIKIRDAENLPTIQFGDSEQLAVGQQVVAVGAPLGLSGTVTSGIVSAMDRPVRASQGGGESSLIDAIQTDAAINPGNSGGPLVDMNGNLVGMNSVIATLSTGNTAGSIGLGFAIPSNFAQRVAEQLLAEGEASQPMLGVTVDGANPVDGALIVGVQPDGPGADAGLEEGEVITRLNNRNIDTSDALIAAVRSHDFGETVTLEVVDPETDERKEVQVTLSVE
ncbi:trypsin-like serine protease [Corynebacterium maris DSM 45190]|uniref:Trypsin-like serine protease n=1 Tax=Corynebacterium maris DSM 45190 TaxID=1224163 RepID=S5T159_9CORY|nr:trypsin-like peptidase domain-containing protein [Corynebacterium maris]AGS34295.1 trypsin-like serine protease [Corynebacterium maris DSM 45190]